MVSHPVSCSELLVAFVDACKFAAYMKNCISSPRMSVLLSTNIVLHINVINNHLQPLYLLYYVNMNYV